MKPLRMAMISLLLIMAAVSTAQSAEWEAVTGEKNLRNLMSGTKAERTLPNGEISRGEYNSDGTGTLYSWGAVIPRTWEVRDDDQICITAERVTNCYRFEKNTADPTLTLYRAGDAAGNLVSFVLQRDAQLSKLNRKISEKKEVQPPRQQLNWQLNCLIRIQQLQP